MEELSLVVTVHELDIIMQCMAEQPYKIVAGLIAKLENQANCQPKTELKEVLNG